MLLSSLDDQQRGRHDGHGEGKVVRGRERQVMTVDTREVRLGRSIDLRPLMQIVVTMVDGQEH